MLVKIPEHGACPLRVNENRVVPTQHDPRGGARASRHGARPEGNRGS